MDFLSMREFRRVSNIWDKIEESNGTLVLTKNGKPSAVVIGVEGNDFEDTLTLIKQAEALKAVRNMRMQALENSEMSMDDIDAEIAATRKERSGYDSHSS